MCLKALAIGVCTGYSSDIANETTTINRLNKLYLIMKEEMKMKKIRSKSKKGFTLVELIVVLVILAILAAMLVPALTGYIKRAREEKDYQMAATVLTAAQSAATYQYSKLSTSSGTTTINWGTSAGNNTTVSSLTGDASGKVTACSFTMDNSTGLFTGTGTVTIDGHTYTWTASTGEWSVS